MQRADTLGPFATGVLDELFQSDFGLGYGRDLAVVLPESVSVGDVTKVIVASAGLLLTAAQLFDVYTGQQVSQGSRSLAFSLTFQANDRTLTDIEVDEHYKNIVVSLEKTFTAKLR